MNGGSGEKLYPMRLSRSRFVLVSSVLPEMKNDIGIEIFGHWQKVRTVDVFQSRYLAQRSNSVFRESSPIVFDESGIYIDG